MKFWKVEAVGNDFVLVHDTESLDLSELAVRLCHRHFGIGSDGLLVLKGRELRMFNPDGTEDFCGNGLRCAAVHAFHQGFIAEADTMIHHGRPVRVWITGPSSSRVELPPASFRPEDVPTQATSELWDSPLEVLGEPMVISAVSTGSTHCVHFVDAMPNDLRFEQQSAALEHHVTFPERTSTMWVVPEGDRSLRMRPFERGVGETRGCGTGSAAAAVCWSRKTGITGEIQVINTGGPVLVHLESWTSPILLESETVEVFSGTVQPELLPISSENVLR